MRGLDIVGEHGAIIGHLGGVAGSGVCRARSKGYQRYEAGEERDRAEALAAAT